MTSSDTSSTPTEPAPLHRKRGRGRFWHVFPLVWLGYLYFPIKSFLGQPHTALETLLSGLGLLVFVGVWLAVYLLRLGQSNGIQSNGTQQNGTQPRLLLAGFAACVLLYVAGLDVIGYDSATFLVYAAALIGFQGSLTLAGSGLLLIAAALLTPGWLGFARLGLADLVQILILSCVAMYGNHAGYRQNVASVRLARVQAEKEKLAADAERERIARDLHDLLGHTLSVIVLKSELAGKLAERDPARAAQEIREVERISREALVEVRAAVSGYRGSGLSAELARSKVALATSGVRLDLDAEAVSLPPGVEYAMEMVLREAVTNIVRHARARAVTVRISQIGAQYVLEVQDDGAGQGTEGPLTEGTGLTSMRERVRAAGGQFALNRAQGLTVRASFPLTQGLPPLTTRPVTA